MPTIKSDLWQHYLPAFKKMYLNFRRNLMEIKAGSLGEEGFLFSARGSFLSIEAFFALMEFENPGVSSSQSVTTSHQQHSQWLLTALSEAEESRKAILRILEGDRDVSAATSDGQKTLRVIQMLKELNKRYRCLAHEHDLLRSKLLYTHGLGSSSSPSSSSSSSSSSSGDKKLACTTISKDSHSGTFFNIAVFDGNITRLADDLASSPKRKLEQPSGENENQNAGVDCRVSSRVEIRVAELMQENMHLQVELARRNDEKRDAIKGLQIEVERLKIENRSLQICVRHSQMGLRRNRSQISRIAGPVLSKFFGRGTP